MTSLHFALTLPHSVLMRNRLRQTVYKNFSVVTLQSNIRHHRELLEFIQVVVVCVCIYISLIHIYRQRENSLIYKVNHLATNGQQSMERHDGHYNGESCCFGVIANHWPKGDDQDRARDGHRNQNQEPLQPTVWNAP